MQLAELFNDVRPLFTSSSIKTDSSSQVAMLVEAQDIQIMQVEAQADMAAQDMEKGMLETKKAVSSARGSRKKRWWCFGILVVLLVRPFSALLRDHV